MERQYLIKSISALEALLKKLPEQPKISRQLALTYLELGRFDEQARSIYEQAARHNPDELSLQTALSTAILVQDAEEFLRTVDSENLPEEKKLAEYSEEFSRLSARYPQSASLSKIHGQLLILQGRGQEGLPFLKHAISLAPETSKAIFSQLLSFWEAGLELATPLLSFLVEYAVEEDEVQLAYRLLQQAYGKGVRTPELLRRLAEILNRQIRAAEAKETRVNLLIQLTRVYLELGEVSKAVATADQIDFSLLKDCAPIKQIARILIAADDFRHAFDFLSQIPLDEETKKLINEITVKLEERGELDTALYLLRFIDEHDILLKEVSERRKRELESATEFSLAELARKKGKFQQALDYLLKVLKSEEGLPAKVVDKINLILTRHSDYEPGTVFEIGKVIFEKGDPTRASLYFELVVQRVPHFPEALDYLEKIYQSSLELDSEISEIRLKLGDIRFLKGDYPGAIEEYQRATDDALFETEARQRLARAYFRQGATEMALSQLKITSLDSEQLDLLYGLLQAFVNNGNYQAALESVELLLTLNPDYRDARQWHSRIQQILKEQELTAGTDEQISQIIGPEHASRYRFIEKLGSGGMGIVYKVFDRKVSQNVALKVLRESLSQQDRALHRFFWEALIVAKLKHPNIVEIYDYNISPQPGKSYISMEFVDGPTLREVLDERIMESAYSDLQCVRRILYYIIQLCDALAATHRRGIVHRDIKPDNIMINRKEAVKITDFGIVHIEKARMTPTGAMVGTPRYMSPEQIQGGQVDARSDIYSVGVILYEMLVGTPPFLSGDVVYQHLNVPPTPPRQLIPSIPEPVNDIILKSLAKKSEDRYQSAIELKFVLENTLKELGGYEPSLFQSITEHDAPHLDEEFDSAH